MYFSTITRLSFFVGRDRKPAIAKNLFDVPKGVFHFGTLNTGFQFVGIQLLSGAEALSNEPKDVLTELMLTPLLDPQMAGITEDSLLVTPYRWTHIVNVSSRGADAVNQTQCVIDTNVHLYAKVPIFALSGLMHFRITFTSNVLGGAGSVDNSDIDNTAFMQHQPVFLHMPAHLFE